MPVEYRPVNAFKAYYSNSMGNSVILLLGVFPNEYLAFGLFKKYASFFANEKNFCFLGNTVIFRRDQIIGTLFLPEGDNWNFPKLFEFMPLIDSGYSIPRIFDSFPINNRIPNSETVCAIHFLGLDCIGHHSQVE